VINETLHSEWKMQMVATKPEVSTLLVIAQEIIDMQEILSGIRRCRGASLLIM